MAYIDADALLENLKKQYGEDLGWQCPVNMSDIGMMIEDAPTADVAEVVRCKDCTHRVDYQGGIMCNVVGNRVDGKWYGLRATAKDHFCSYGERKVVTDTNVGSK